MRIPTEFTLINRKFTVSWMHDETHDIADCVGASHHGQGKVLIYDRTEGPQYNEHTFLHELVHMILESMGCEELSKNEDFVDRFAAILHQYMQTKKGRLE